MTRSFDHDVNDRTVTLTTDDVVLRIQVATEALRSLAGVDGAGWVDRRSLLVGSVLGQPVHWSK